MAYGNYQNGYQMPIYGQVYPQMQAQPLQQQPQQPQNGIQWVQGEAGAKSYLVAAGNTVMLMDSETQRFYIKSTDANGMPHPLQVYEYRRVNEAQTPASVPTITREEYDALGAKINELTEKVNKLEAKEAEI